MKALYRVKNSNNKTVGFLTKDGYFKYYEVLQNIHLFNNFPNSAV